MTTIIDTNILIYLADPNCDNHISARNAFNRCREDGPILLTDIAYAELSIGMADKEATDAVVQAFNLQRVSMTDDALFVTGRLFRAYKERTGSRERALPDHYIAAHAKVLGAKVLTHNIDDYSNVGGLNVVGLQ